MSWTVILTGSARRDIRRLDGAAYSASIGESSDTLIVVQLLIRPRSYHPVAACRDEVDTASAPPVVV